MYPAAECGQRDVMEQDNVTVADECRCAVGACQCLNAEARGESSAAGNRPGNVPGLGRIDLQCEGMATAQEASRAPPVYPAYGCTAGHNVRSPEDG